MPGMMQKKKQKEIVAAFRKDTAAVKEFVTQLQADHEQAFSQEENQALAATIQFFNNLEVFFSGLKQGIRG